MPRRGGPREDAARLPSLPAPCARAARSWRAPPSAAPGGVCVAGFTHDTMGVTAVSGTEKEQAHP